MIPSGNSFSRLMHWRNSMWTQRGIIDARGQRAALVGVVLFACCILISAPYAHAQETPPATPASPTLSNDGIFGCRGVGAQVANVGTTAVTGAVYVPVRDADVILNTGFLVYKECVLDGVSRKIAENLTA